MIPDHPLLGLGLLIPHEPLSLLPFSSEPLSEESHGSHTWIHAHGQKASVLPRDQHSARHRSPDFPSTLHDTHRTGYVCDSLPGCLGQSQGEGQF